MDMRRLWSQSSWFWRCILLLAAAYFVTRGPLRALEQSGDFLTLYASGRSWLHGDNPYAAADLLTAANAGGASVNIGQFAATPMLYLPSVLPLLVPLSLLPWALARILWTMVSLASFVWALWGLNRLAGGLSIAVVAALLAFAPVHTALGRGQPTLLVCALLIASLTVSQPWIAGILLGLGLCIKPQMGWGLVLLFLLSGEGRKLLASAATFFLFSAFAILPMSSAALRTFWANDASLSPVTGMVAGASSEPLAFQLIGLDTLIPTGVYTTPVAIVCYALVVAITLFALRKRVDRKLAIAVAVSATLLVGYQRFYNAQMLWLGLPAMLALPRRAAFRILQVCYGLFLIPGQTIAADPSYFLYLVFGKNSSFSMPENFWTGIVLHQDALAVVVVWIIFVLKGTRQPSRVSLDFALQSL